MTDTPVAIFNPENVASSADLLIQQRPINCEKPPPGMHLPFPGFIHFGHYMPQRDINALHYLGSELFHRHGALKIAEIGSFTGASTIALAHYAGVLYSIDTWQGSDCQEDGANELYRQLGGGAIFQAFLRNTSHLSNIVVCEPHDTFWKEWRAGPMHLIFIDGDHTYEAVKQDIAEARELITLGGILCGHDYNNPCFPGVTQAVREHFGQAGISASLHVYGQVWYVEAPCNDTRRKRRKR